MEEEEKIKYKVRVWNQTVYRYGMQKQTLEDSLSALLFILHENMSKVMKANTKAKKCFIKAEKENDTIWLLTRMEDMIVNFEENKAPLLATHDQMEVIMKIREDNHNNEDFLKFMENEVKICQKHVDDFLWGKTQKEKFTSRNRVAKTFFS